MAGVDESATLPTTERYAGSHYKEGHNAIDALVMASAHFLIISGRYGLVLPSKPISRDNREFKCSMWPNHVIGRRLAAYAEKVKAETSGTPAG